MTTQSPPPAHPTRATQSSPVGGVALRPGSQLRRLLAPGRRTQRALPGQPRGRGALQQRLARVRQPETRQVPAAHGQVGMVLRLTHGQGGRTEWIPTSGGRWCPVVGLRSPNQTSAAPPIPASLACGSGPGTSAGPMRASRGCCLPAPPRLRRVTPRRGPRSASWRGSTRRTPAPTCGSRCAAAGWQSGRGADGPPPRSATRPPPGSLTCPSAAALPRLARRNPSETQSAGKGRDGRTLQGGWQSFVDSSALDIGRSPWRGSWPSWRACPWAVRSSRPPGAASLRLHGPSMNHES